MAASVVIMKNWFDTVKQYLSESQMDKLYALVVRYGLDRIKKDSGDPLVDIAFTYIQPQIDNMQTSYSKERSFGMTHGRHSTFDEDENDVIYQLRMDGFSMKEIAEVMGITDEKKKKAIYNSDGWRAAALDKA